MNAKNRSSCRFCGLTFANLYGGPTAADRVEEHEDRCRGNPHNQCRYCGIIFSGQRNLQRHLLTSCTQKREVDVVRMRYEAATSSPRMHFYHADATYMAAHHAPPPAAPPAGTAFVYPQYYYWAAGSGLPAASAPHDTQENQAKAEIAGIEAKLMFYRGSALRQELRKLLLSWHPDKCSHANPEVSCAVFAHIKERWNQLGHQTETEA